MAPSHTNGNTLHRAVIAGGGLDPGTVTGFHEIEQQAPEQRQAKTRSLIHASPGDSDPAVPTWVGDKAHLGDRRRVDAIKRLL
jgi:hypothetical protein